MKNTTVGLVTIVAVTAILLASMLTEDALAKKCKSKGGEVHQVLAQSCVNTSQQNARCINTGLQQAGHDQSGSAIGNQP
jgi:gas vesicle protein